MNAVCVEIVQGSRCNDAALLLLLLLLVQLLRGSCQIGCRGNTFEELLLGEWQGT